MPKRRYLLAIACYLAMPVAMIGGAALASLIDPEMSRGRADYERDFRLLELVQQGVLAASAGLMLVLWAASCHLVLASRQRSPLWLALGATPGFHKPYSRALLSAAKARIASMRSAATG